MMKELKRFGLIALVIVVAIVGVCNLIECGQLTSC